MASRKLDHNGYACLLRQCGRAKSLSDGKVVHSEIVVAGYGHNLYLGNLLVQMYGKCGSVEDSQLVFEGILGRNVFSWTILITACSQNGKLDEARIVFERFPETNVVSWNTMITEYLYFGNLRDARKLFDEMPERNEISWNLIANRYAINGNLYQAKNIFDNMPSPTSTSWHMMIMAYCSNGCLTEAKCMLDHMPKQDTACLKILFFAYAQNGHFKEANRMFDIISLGDVGVWNSMVTAYVSSGQNKEAIEVSRRMDLEGVKSNKITIMNVLEACARCSSAASEGRNVHLKAIESGLDFDKAVGTALLNMYGKCKSPYDAGALFAMMPEKDVVACTAMVSAYAENGLICEARHTFDCMLQRNSVSWSAMVTAYAQNGKTQRAVDVFSRMPYQDTFSMTALLGAYAKDGYLEDARSTFNNTPQHDIVSWTAMISACAQNEQNKEALKLFCGMDLCGIYPNKATFLVIVNASGNLGNLTIAKIIHEEINNGLEEDLMLQSALVDMYGRCKCLADAKTVFCSMNCHDVVAYNSMIAAYVHNGDIQEAKSLFDSMRRRSPATWNALISAYAQSGNLEEARSVFEEMPQGNVISWTTLIAAYFQQGQPQESLHLFRLMDLSGVQPNNITFTNICDACGCLDDLCEREIILAEVLDDGCLIDMQLGTALVNAYGKCSNLHTAKKLFDAILRPYIQSWNAMLAAYSYSGKAKESLELFELLLIEGVHPDCATFSNLLFACNHAGLTIRSHRYFVAAWADHNVLVTSDLYIYMVDILARAGQLNEAEELISSMPFEPHPVVWTSLLSACKMNGQTIQGGRAAQYAFEQDPNNGAAYTLLSNIYST